MTPEEHKRRGDAADALFHEMKRQIAEKAAGGLIAKGVRRGPAFFAVNTQSVSLLP